MANLFSSFLNNLGQGLTRPKGNLGDFAHAAKLYNDSAFRLAPKTKFLYHVVFNFAPTVMANTSFKEQHQTTVGLLVKSVDLPKFKITVDGVQQYNRKKQIQTKLEYDPITVQFHDDSLGVSTALWSFYYGYYFADSSHGGSAGAAKGSFKDSLVSGLKSFVGNLVPGIGKLFGNQKNGNGSSEATRPLAYQRNSYSADFKHRYGLDRDSSVPFFTSIQIFQLSKQQYQSYTLINPIITSWQHDKLDSADEGTATNTMTIAYEAVIYGTGKVSTGNPKGFASEFYDKSPSPLSLLGGGKVGLFGQGGILGGAADVIGNITSGAAFTSPSAFLGTLIKGANIVNNAKRLTKEGLRQEAFGLVEGALSRASGVNLSGVTNAFFPKSAGRGQSQTTPTRTKTVASNGPLPADAVRSYFSTRPNALDSIAKNTVFQKEQGTGNINQLNARWASLSSAAKDRYKQAALDKIISGAPEVQAQYNSVKQSITS